MQTSAGIGLHFVEGLQRKVARSAVVEGALRALAGSVAAVAVAALCALGLAAHDATARARCGEERDHAGFGMTAALRAMDTPLAQQRFAYRVSPDPAGYRVEVVARRGAFAGDAWERDALGRVRHKNDVCAP